MDLVQKTQPVEQHWCVQISLHKKCGMLFFLNEQKW